MALAGGNYWTTENSLLILSSAIPGLEESFELPVMLIDATEQQLWRIDICHDSSDVDASIGFVLLSKCPQTASCRLDQD